MQYHPVIPTPTDLTSSYNAEFPPQNKTTGCYACPIIGEIDCKMYLNSGLMIAVIVANVVKVVVMILMVLTFTKPSIVTLGDGIASFLTSEDLTTIGLRKIQKPRFRQSTWIFQDSVTYAGTQKRWRSSISRLKWGLSISMQVKLCKLAPLESC
jgi:hypothetical protein